MNPVSARLLLALAALLDEHGIVTVLEALRDGADAAADVVDDASPTSDYLNALSASLTGCARARARFCASDVLADGLRVLAELDAELDEELDEDALDASEVVS